MRLKQLQYVVEVSKCKSFSKASKKLFIAQPSLSTAISTLEDELGCIIFHRTPQGAILTEDGKKIVEQAELVLNDVDELFNITQKTTKEYVITLAAIPAACNSLTTDLLVTLSENFPEITVNILEIRPQKILSSISNGLADIVIGSYTPATRNQVLLDAKKNALQLEPLFDDCFYAYLSRNHPKARSRSVTLKELTDERQAIFNDFVLIECDDTLCSEEKNVSDCYTFSDRSSIKQAVAAGLAYAVLPRQMVLGDLYVNSGLIRAIPVVDNNVPVTNYLAWRKSTHPSKQETIVLDLIRSLYNDVQKRLQKHKSFLPNESEENLTLRY